MKIVAILIILFMFNCTATFAQLTFENKNFTHADTLRGSLNEYRIWWDVQRYDITVQPDYNTKTITAKNIITYKVVAASYPAFMQIDLQEPLIIDSVLFNGSRKLNFEKKETVWMVQAPKQVNGSIGTIHIYYHGRPRQAIRPPWDGGWIWVSDEKGRPWMSVACQGLGASVWYPCKDHQSDEPDKGASLKVIIPDSLYAVGNGRLTVVSKRNGIAQYLWEVKDPINNYNIIPYIGKYVNFSEKYKGVKGDLDVTYEVLDYNVAKAKAHIVPDVHRMLKAFEYWFGPYPFYEDGYKIVDAPHLGMEHQSAIAYGNKYMNGYLGNDRSGSGWGNKFDFIIVHESAHEWFANSITSKDLGDMWIHEGFANYSETLFTDYWYGKKAGDEYNYGSRKGIRNDKPVIGPYGVNKEGSGDMYPKGGNLLHTIRHSINNDEKFRSILHGLCKTFYHQTVTTQQVENYISTNAGFDYSKVFDQYLRTTQIPQLEFYTSSDRSKVFFRYTNCVTGFNLPLSIYNGAATIKIYPTESWQSVSINTKQQALFNPVLIESLYYISATITKQ